MKIYTKRGDQGKTSLVGGEEVDKFHPRVEAYGTVDELNSVLGLMLVHLENQLLEEKIHRVQQELFCLGTELSAINENPALTKTYLQISAIQELESEIDAWENELPTLKSFILPGGSLAAGLAHLARTICRRAERRTVELAEIEELRDLCVVYLNRLSDWLFVLARMLNKQSGKEDILWLP